ncbi:MAG: mechanosensitive ion channel [Tatlockia sp.]|nr:mechanosensitive ion channel [Tatlockia sp.]
MQYTVDNFNGFSASALVFSIIVFSTCLVVAFNHYVAKHVFIALIDRLFSKNHSGLGKILIKNRLPHRIAYLAPALLIHQFSYVFDIDYPTFKLFLASLVKQISEIYIMFDLGFILLAILNCINDRYNQYPLAKIKPIKSYLQLIKIAVIVFTVILFASMMIDKPPIYFISGFGAATAFLALIFKDLVMGFVASIQLTAYDMVRIGDWIEMPNFAADGEVIEISLNTVKVQNFDKTIVTIPSYSLLTSGLKNWRGMHEAGGRRVKRSIMIDINSIKLIDDNFITKMNDLIAEPKISTNSQTNLGCFRHYLQNYLSQHKSVHKNLKILIRQLQGSSTGLPLELYFFTNETDSMKYEAIQSEIIEHVYAIMSRFDLRAFQYANTWGSESN